MQMIQRLLPGSATGFSALQRAEIAEIIRPRSLSTRGQSFSALQRAEIAEILAFALRLVALDEVSVLFNEPKLLKSVSCAPRCGRERRFSALQRAEIAEMLHQSDRCQLDQRFQCSSTSRNC